MFRAKRIWKTATDQPNSTSRSNVEFHASQGLINSDQNWNLYLFRTFAVRIVQEVRNRLFSTSLAVSAFRQTGGTRNQTNRRFVYLMCL